MTPAKANISPGGFSLKSIRPRLMIFFGKKDCTLIYNTQYNQPDRFMLGEGQGWWYFWGKKLMIRWPKGCHFDYAVTRWHWHMELSKWPSMGNSRFPFCGVVNYSFCTMINISDKIPMHACYVVDNPISAIRFIDLSGDWRVKTVLFHTRSYTFVCTRVYERYGLSSCSSCDISKCRTRLFEVFICFSLSFF